MLTSIFVFINSQNWVDIFIVIKNIHEHTHIMFSRRQLTYVVAQPIHPRVG